MNLLRNSFFCARFLIQPISRCPVRSIVGSIFPDITPVKKNFVEHLLSNVDKYQNDIAVINGITGDSYRYSEFMQLTKNISSGLTKRHIGNGDVVCIIMANAPEFLFSMCGILATGATVTFGNPAATSDEFAVQLKNSKTKIIITSNELTLSVQKAASIAKCVEDIYVVNGKPDGCRSFNDELMNDDCSANVYGQVKIDANEDVGFLPYSSGTTGTPKGVMLTHATLCTNLEQYMAVETMRCGKETFLIVLPLYHVYSSLVGFSTSIFTGGKAVLLPKFDPKTFLSAIEKYKVSFMHLVPPLIHFLSNHPLVDDFDLSSIRYIVSGAAPLDSDGQLTCLNRLRKFSPDIDIYQLYGLSEASPMVNVMPPKEMRKPNKANSIGVLLPNIESKIISTTGDELGPDEKGELVIRGPNIMKGYLNNPKATAESIFDGWFHTGDIAVYDEDHYFYIVDRLKEIIKYKGLQVAPAELEGILLTHPQIRDCSVVGLPDDRCGELPVAFVVKKDIQNDSLNQENVQTFIAERVSDYKKLRGGVHFINEIPRSASGKILRRELKKMLLNWSKT